MKNKKYQKEMTVTMKKKVTTEKGDGTIETKYKTTLSDGSEKIIIESSSKNDLLRGEDIRITLAQSQGTLIEVEKWVTSL